MSRGLSYARAHGDLFVQKMVKSIMRMCIRSVTWIVPCEGIQEISCFDQKKIVSNEASGVSLLGVSCARRTRTFLSVNTSTSGKGPKVLAVTLRVSLVQRGSEVLQCVRGDNHIKG